MFVQVRAVEVGEAVLVRGKVRGHPVQDHPDASLVQRVDEEHEILRGAVTACGREEAGDLVAPGAVEGVLHHRHELDVGETRLRHVLREPRCQLAVREPPAVLLRHSHPRARVHLVDGHRGIESVAGTPRRHPLRVAPGVVQVPDDGSGLRRGLVVDAERVGLVRPVAVKAGVHVVLVDVALAEAGYEALPDPRLAPRPEKVAPLVPAVEIARHRQPLGVRRPDREVDTFGAVGGDHVRAQLVVEIEVTPLVEQEQVVLGEQANVVPHRPVGLAHGQLPFPGALRMCVTIAEPPWARRGHTVLALPRAHRHSDCREGRLDRPVCPRSRYMRRLWIVLGWSVCSPTQKRAVTVDSVWARSSRTLTATVCGPLAMISSNV